MSVQYCPNCGSALDDPNAQFCPNCGAAIDTAVAPTTEVPPPPITPEGQVVYAGFLERVVAYIIDIIILLVVSLLGIVSILGQIADYFDVWGLFMWLIAFLYFWLLESYNSGQTIGKMAMKIRTVDESSLNPAEPGNLVINNLSRGWFILLDLLIGVIANFAVQGGTQKEKKRYRILQNLSSTVVIKEA